MSAGLAGVGQKRRRLSKLYPLGAASAMQRLFDLLKGLPSLHIEISGKRISCIVDKTDVAGKPYDLATLAIWVEGRGRGDRPQSWSSRERSRRARTGVRMIAV
jgi:hypothetical protein